MASHISSPPRVWGRRRESAHRRLPRADSPPRVWGRLLRHAGCSSLRGFTPTRVGETSSRQPQWPRAHRFTPTRVGKTSQIRAPAALARFTPRVWGRLLRHAGLLFAPRFTPTRVGKTLEQVERELGGLVHPHACGRRRTRQCSGHHSGFTPRVWGRRHDGAAERTSPVVHLRVWGRLVRRANAHLAAGFTCACGEDEAEVERVTRRAGSPPRVWGRHPSTRPPRRQWGSPRVWGEDQTWRPGWHTEL